MYEHESMHLYFFHVSLVVLNYKKNKKMQGLNWSTSERERTGQLHPRGQKARGDVKRSPRKKRIAARSLSKEPDLILPPV